MLMVTYYMQALAITTQLRVLVVLALIDVVLVVLVVALKRNRYSSTTTT